MVRRGSTVRVRQRACTKTLQMGLFVVCPDAAPASRGYETGTFSDTRTLAGTRDLFEGVVETGDRGSAVRKRLQTAVDAGSAGAVLTTSFAREGAYGFDWCDTTSANPDAPPNCGTRSGQQSVPRLP
jgi:hypothetical protein